MPVLARVSTEPDELGLLPFLEPRIKTTVEERNNLKKELSSLKHDTIAVEGKSDKLIFQKAIELFSPDLNKLIQDGHLAIEYSTAGADGVADRLIEISYSNKFRCFGIFDNDTAGKQGTDKVSQNEKSKKHMGSRIQFTELKLNAELGKIKTEFPFEFELEDLYSREVWQYAYEKQFLERRKIKVGSNFPHNKTIKVFVSEKFKDAHLKILILKQIKDGKKESVANWIVKNNNASNFLINFKPTVEKIERFFIGPSITAGATEPIPDTVVSSS